MKAFVGAKRRLITALTGAVVLFSVSANAAVTTMTIRSGDRYFLRGPMECVPYARYFVASLPTGLWDKQSKLRIINSYTPKVGSVAVVDMSSYGHVAVVVALDNVGSSRSIMLAEHNVPLGTSSPRYRYATCGSNIADCQSQLRIVGYYRP